MRISRYTLLAVLTALLISIFLFFVDGDVARDYRGIWLLPLAGAISMFTMLSGRRRVPKPFQITYHVVGALIFIRLVATPFCIYLAGPQYVPFDYLNVSARDISTAINLIAYETLIAAIFLRIVSGFFGRRQSFYMSQNYANLNYRPRLSGSMLVYMVVALVGVVLILAWGIPSGALNFISIRPGTVHIERGGLDMVLIQLCLAGTWLGFLLVASQMAPQFGRRGSPVKFGLALFIGVLLVMIIFGDRRSVQIYTGVSVISALVACFPARKKTILVSIMGATVFTILSITIWRLFERHDLAASSEGLDYFALAKNLEAYTGGPFQVAAVNGLLESTQINLNNVAFDFVRSTFGLNFFIDKDALVSSQIMNESIYRGQFQSGWLIFATSYGYVLFGVIFTPVFLLLNLSIAMYTESVIHKARGLEIKFLFTYLLMRIIAFPFNATPLLISFYTIQLFTIGAVFFVAKLVKGLDKPYTRNMAAGMGVGAIDNPRYNS